MKIGYPRRELTSNPSLMLARTLEAMTDRTPAILGASVLALGLMWVLVPPFPSTKVLIRSSWAALTQEFGIPQELPPEGAGRWHPAKSVVWKRSRGIAVWTLEAAWNKAPVDSGATPDMVSRCLLWEPHWWDAHFPCDAASMARVMASNNRWRGRESR